MARLVDGELEEAELELRQAVEAAAGLVGGGEPREDGDHLCVSVCVFKCVYM